MPTAGRPKVSTRVDPVIVAQIRAQLKLTKRHANNRTILDEEVATFVEVAIVEKLAKMRRCRGGSELILEKEEESRGECQSTPAS